MMQNAVNETFWDAQNLEIESCANSYNFLRIREILGICACLNLEVLGVPEGLVHSIGILETPAVFLARRWHRC